jgi:hypothetical protein
MNPDEIQKAKQALNFEKQARAKACSDVIQRALSEHRCQLTHSITLTSEGRMLPQLSITALDDVMMPGPVPDQAA